jgi:beta-N-acetylhexosaminidase
LLPLKQPTNACLFLLAENRYGQQGRKMNEEVQKRTTMRTLLMDPLMPQLEIDQALQKYSDCGEIVVAAFVTASAYRGNVALAGNLPAFVNGLLQGKTPVILISLGNPYLLRSFPAVGAYMATFSPATTSETAAVKALFGEIPITGKMPVSIPGLAQIGDGLSMERKQ